MYSVSEKVIYKITYKQCQKEYICVICRNLKKRTAEHGKDLKMNNPTGT